MPPPCGLPVPFGITISAVTPRWMQTLISNFPSACFHAALIAVAEIMAKKQASTIALRLSGSDCFQTHSKRADRERHRRV